MESVQSEVACSPAKKLKVDDCVKEYVHDDIKDLSEFKLDKIINNNTNRKSVCLKGTFASKTGDALVLLEKTAFAEESLLKDNSYFSKDCSLEKIFHNDIYGDYRYFPKVELNGMFFFFKSN